MSSRPADGDATTSGDAGIAAGDPLPLGLHECCDGFNLAVFSRHATGMTLLVFDHPDDAVPGARIVLDPRRHRTGDIWHARIAANLRGKLYALAADGPEAAGHRFDPERPLLDPYAPALAGAQRSTPGAVRPGGPRGVVLDQRFDWQGDRPLCRPWSETILYETHVRGLTIHPSSGVRHPGQYLGVVERIPYLRRLGVTALELMPVQAFNPHGIDRRNPLTGESLRVTCPASVVRIEC